MSVCNGTTPVTRKVRGKFQIQTRKTVIINEVLPINYVSSTKRPSPTRYRNQRQVTVINSPFNSRKTIKTMHNTDKAIYHKKQSHESKDSAVWISSFVLIRKTKERRKNSCGACCLAFVLSFLKFQPKVRIRELNSLNRFLIN